MLYLCLVNLKCIILFSSLLSGSGDGSIAIHDLHYSSIVPKHTFPCVSSIDQSNPYKHKYSVETVQWYPLDTGMFLSSGMDKIIKVWDTNNLTVSISFLVIYIFNQSIQ